MKNRIQKLQAFLLKTNLDCVVLHHAPDIFYYSGSIQPLYLFVPASGYPFAIARKSIDRMQHEIGEMRSYPFKSSVQMKDILENEEIIKMTRIGIASDVISYSSFLRLQQLLPGAEWIDASWDIKKLRMVKSDDEIAILAESGKIMHKIPEIVREVFQPGMTELQLSAGLEYYLRNQGHDALIRCRREGVEMSGFGVVSCGANSLAGTKFEGVCGGTGLCNAIPYGATNKIIPENTPIIIDFAFVRQGYILDQTRMACIGEIPTVVSKAYNAMLKIEEEILNFIRPGVTWESVYFLSAKLAKDMGYEEEYMGYGTEKVKFVGHGVGLELDEPPFLAPGMKDEIEENMTIAIEPKVGLPGIGIVGVEDTIVIKNGAPQILTTCPRDIITIL
jgi:Xaa-Pro dipeptidase